MTKKIPRIFGYIVAGVSLMMGSVANAAIILPPSPKVTLSWDYPADQLGTNLTFKIYHTTNLSIPLANWTVLTNVVGTSLSVKVPLGPGNHFFSITAADSSGESPFATTSF